MNPSGLAPGGVVLAEDGQEAIAVGGLEEVDHFVDDDVFEEVFGLGDELGVEADVMGSVFAAAPFGFHALEEVGGDFDFELGFPLLDDLGNRFVQEGFVPIVDDGGAFRCVGSWADG